MVFFSDFVQGYRLLKYHIFSGLSSSEMALIIYVANCTFEMSGQHDRSLNRKWTLIDDKHVTVKSAR